MTKYLKALSCYATVPLKFDDDKKMTILLNRASENSSSNNQFHFGLSPRNNNKPLFNNNFLNFEPENDRELGAVVRKSSPS